MDNAEMPLLASAHLQRQLGSLRRSRTPVADEEGLADAYGGRYTQWRRQNVVRGGHWADWTAVPEYTAQETQPSDFVELQTELKKINYYSDR